MKRLTGTRSRTIMLVVECRQILPVLEHQRTLMITSMLVGIYIIILLVLNLLSIITVVLWMLLELSLMLPHLLLSATGVVPHVVQIL